jgi:hypothetical protein
MNEMIYGLTRAFPEVAPEPFSKVYELSGPHEDRFVAHSRTVHLPGSNKRIHFCALHWADITTILPGRLSSFLGIFRIVLECQTLVMAILPRSKGVLYPSLRKLLLLASALVSGPVVALTVCMFVLGLGAFHGYAWIARAADLLHLTPNDIIGQAVISLLVLLLLLSVVVMLIPSGSRYARYKQDYHGTLRLIGIGSALLASFFLLRDMLSQGARSTTSIACSYIEGLLHVLLIVWLLWSAVLFFALFLVVVISVRGVGIPRIARAATSIVVLQSTLWLLLLSVFGSPLFGHWNIRGIIERLQHDEFPTCHVDIAINDYYLPTVGFAILVAIAIIVTQFLRWCIPLRIPDNPFRPRLIVSPLIIMAALMGGAVCVAYFARAYVESYVSIGGYGPFDYSYNMYASFHPLPKEYAGLFTVVFGLISLFVLRVGLSDGIHIARDVIDYQFELPNSTAPDGEILKPRRQRIFDRLNAIYRCVVEPDLPDKLIFVAHSQGSVIVMDYLLQAGGEQKAMLMLRPDIITIGSPIQHLYGHYFHEYGNLAEKLATISKHINRWINIYRRNDYIGSSIRSECIENNALPAHRRWPHQHYWFESYVAQALMKLVLVEN